MHLSNQSNYFFHDNDLQSLSEIRSDKEPVFSLFLDLRPEEHSGDLLDRFEILLKDKEQQKKIDQDHPTERKQWDQEANRIRRWLETERPTGGQGLVLYSFLDENLWRVFLLPVPVLDRLEVGDRPFVRPLEILSREFQCTLAILIDAGSARLINVFLGRAEEVASFQAMPVTGDALEEGLRQHAYFVMERAETIWLEHGCARLVLGGSDETLIELREALPQTMRAHLAGELPLSPQVELDEILAEVQAIEDDLERQLEAQRVEELITRAENSAEGVLGLEQTLLAVKSEKVRLLVVQEDFHLEGGECPNCGFLGEGEEEVCLLCGMALRPEPDIIESALKRVLDQGGEIEVLRSEESRFALELYGRIGALLHQSRIVPHEHETANQLPITRDGEINREALHDEAVQESFPASDPPSF